MVFQIVNKLGNFVQRHHQYYFKSKFEIDCIELNLILFSLAIFLFNVVILFIYFQSAQSILYTHQ